MASRAEMLVRLLFFGSLCVWTAIGAILYRGRPIVRYEPRRRARWNGWDVFFPAITSILLPIGFASVAILIYGIDREGDTLDPRVLAAANLAQWITLALMLSYLTTRSDVSWRDLGFRTGRIAYDVRLGAVGYLAAILPVYCIQLLLTRWFVSEHPVVKMLEEHHNGATLLLVTFTAVVSAPVVEEFLYRVVLQGWLEASEKRWRRSGNWQWLERARVPRGVMPIIFSSLIFAVMHWGHGPDPIPLFVLALLLGYLYRQTHRIWPSMVLHALFNATSMLQLWLEWSDQPAGAGKLLGSFLQFQLSRWLG